MTVDCTLSLPTTSLVLPTSKLFYPAEIPIGHWQLRSLISSSALNRLYYATESNIWCLHTDTRRRELIALLPFRPYCLVTGCGWVCAGGEHGQLASIKLVSSKLSPQLQESSTSREDIDILLPSNLDPERRCQAHPPLAVDATREGTSTNPHAELQIHNLGGQITNSITIHEWRKVDGGHYDDTVAVIANNDRTVRIFSLTRSEVVTALSFPFPMNQATISPDGKLLVAVGDAPVAYFYTINLSSGFGSSGYEWLPCCDSSLEGSFDSYCEDFGYFCTAFSPSGHLCAVASQDGIITVFDTSLIRESEDQAPAIAFIESSRPRTKPGAIRSMYFSPQPLDLLIWAEDHGRICVVDIRERFEKRQLIHLETKADDVEIADVAVPFATDRGSEIGEQRGAAEFVARYRRAIDAQDITAIANLAADYFEASVEHRGLQRQTRERGTTRREGEGGSHGLTAREQQILDVLRTSRERTDVRERTATDNPRIPISVNYPSTSNLRHSSTPSLSPEEVSRIHSSHSPDTMAITSLPEPYLHFRNNLIRLRESDHIYRPRHRDSVVPSNDFTERSINISTSSHIEPVLNSSLRTSPTHLPSTVASTNITGSWRNIEAALRSGPLPNALIRLRREREHAIDANATRRQHHWTRDEVAGREAPGNLHQTRLSHPEGEGLDRPELWLWPPVRSMHPEWGVRTTGLAMSPSGQKLYVGTEEGIFELQMNVQERKTFPKVEFM